MQPSPLTIDDDVEVFYWRLLRKQVGQIKCTFIKLERDIYKLAATSFDPLIYTLGERTLRSYTLVFIELGKCHQREASHRQRPP